MAWMAAAAVIGGSLLEGKFSRSQQERSIGFQREMAQKAHQYEVADLRKAGLNPILSGTGGGGARASGGAAAQTPGFANSAVAALRLKTEIDNIKANTDLTQNKADILDTGASIGDDVNKMYDYIKTNIPKDAKEASKLINDYKSAISQGLEDQANVIKDRLRTLYRMATGNKKKTNKKEGLGVLHVNPPIKRKSK